MTKPKELLFSLSKEAGDFIVQATKGSGAGGQNRNKRETACRVSHPASGAVGFCQEERYYNINKERAFKRCVESKNFQSWLTLETARQMGKLKDIDQEVEKQMKNIKMEVRDEQGRFVEVGEDYFGAIHEK
jgi:protein subunit release factor B